MLATQYAHAHVGVAICTMSTAGQQIMKTEVRFSIFLIPL